MQSTKMVFFDLDMCAFNTPKIRPYTTSKYKSILDMFEMDEVDRKKAEEMLPHASPIAIAHECALPAGAARALLEAHQTMTIPPDDYSYGDLDHIAALPHEKMLVTAGFAEFQQHKIDRLGIRHLFSEIHIDVVSPDGTHRGKEAIFSEIMERCNISSQHAIVVGDNPKAELGAGRRLGIATVQTLRPGVVRWRDADHHITSFSELQGIIDARAAMVRRRACTPA